MQQSSKLQSYILRIVGSVEMLAFAAVILPQGWMDAIHAWMGLGELPRGVIVEYLTRSVSLIYGLHGVLLWILSYDLVRYRAIISFMACCYLFVGAVFLAIDLSAGMPKWWIFQETAACFACGIGLLWTGREKR